MNPNYKKCPNGHYYSVKLSSCPYCDGNGNGEKTEFQPTITPKSTPNYGEFDEGKTRPLDEPGDSFGYQETHLDGGTNEYNQEGRTIVPNMEQQPHRVMPVQENYTVVLGEEEEVTSTGQKQKVVVQRARRKLVGWLVSYTLDEMGVDFKLYEGKNIIGRNASCQVSLQDPSVSGEHAVILYRNGKYSIKDNQSTAGTFVNDNDIELDAIYLKDGDLIRMGKTVLKFRMSF